MASQPRILVLTLSFGAGHVSAARAIAHELNQQAPVAEVRTIDALNRCPLWFRAFYVWTYWLMIRYAPALWSKYFHRRAARGDEHTAPAWALRRGFKSVFDEIKTFQPDVIVACEVAACEIAVLAKREKLTRTKIVNVITDFEAEPIWVKPEVAAFAVATKQVGEQLQRWGAAHKKIKACGIPTNQSFSIWHDAGATRRKFELGERPIVLLMGGGMGPTKMHEVADKLLRRDAKLQIVALPGNDKSARRRLRKLRDAKNLKILGWTNEVAALMQVADLIVTKPGGVTLAEAAVAGVPLVLFEPIPGPEETNARNFVEKGAAMLARNSQAAAQIVLEISRDQAKRQRMRFNINKIACPEAAAAIARLVFETASESFSPEVGLDDNSIVFSASALELSH